MTQILWDETVPSGTSPVAQAPAFWRSEMTAIAAGLSTDLYWDGSGGASVASRGLLRPGASRAYVAAASASSQNGPSPLGRAFFASDSSALFLYESNGTFKVGSPFAVEYGSGASLGFTPSNVSLFRELSGFTRVSDVTNAGGSPMKSVLLIAANFNAALQFYSVVCSERSVLYNTLTRGVFSDTAVIYYQGLDNACPSTATFYWTATMLMRGVNDPSGVPL